MAQADEPYQQELVRGIVKKSQELGYNVKIFSMYIKYQDNEEREVGDSNIFNLIPFNRFDALILFSDLLQTPIRIISIISGPWATMQCMQRYPISSKSITRRISRI